MTAEPADIVERLLSVADLGARSGEPLGDEEPQTLDPESVIKDLQWALQSSPNDDYSKPMTPERARHVRRMEAMRNAAAEITRLRAALAEQKEECARVAENIKRVPVDYPVTGLVDPHEPTRRGIAAAIRALK